MSVLSSKFCTVQVDLLEGLKNLSTLRKSEVSLHGKYCASTVKWPRKRGGRCYEVSVKGGSTVQDFC